MDWHETDIRVRYAETDQMGIAHHSNYLVWFETARGEFCRSKGFTYRSMEQEADALMVVAESYIRYKSPAFYDDVLTIRTRVHELRSRSVRFAYEVVRRSDDVMIAAGETMHVVTDWEKKVRSWPPFFRDLLVGTDDAPLPDTPPS